MTVIKIEEDKVEEQIKNMDRIFRRNLSEYMTSDFSKEDGEECDRCQYGSICIVEDSI